LKSNLNFEQSLFEKENTGALINIIKYAIA
jgi:hypothetical protein